MKRWTLAVLILLGAALVAGCGGGHRAAPPARVASPARVAPAVTGRGTDHCIVPPGQGRMGVCTPTTGVAPAPLRSSARRFPGEDVSNFQGCVNPTGLTFVIPKTWEWGFHDRFASCTVSHARALGIPYGVYCFGRTNHSATDSGAACVRNSAGLYDSLGIALDIETNDGRLSNQGQCDWIRSFNSTVRALAHLRVNITYDAPGLWPGCSTIPASVGWVADLSRGCTAPLSGLVNYICQFNFHGVHGGDSDVWLRGSPLAFAQAVHGASVPEASAHARALCVELGAIRRYVHDKILKNKRAGRERHWSNYPRRKARAEAIKRAFAKPRTVRGFPGHWRYDCRPDGACTRVKA